MELILNAPVKLFIYACSAALYSAQILDDSAYNKYLKFNMN